MSRHTRLVPPHTAYTESRLIARLVHAEVAEPELGRPSRLAGCGRSMMVCSCQTICESDIHEAVDTLRRQDPAAVLTAGRICRALGKPTQCGNCLPQMIKIILGLDDEDDGTETSGSCRASCDDACLLD